MIPMVAEDAQLRATLKDIFGRITGAEATGIQQACREGISGGNRKRKSDDRIEGSGIEDRRQ